MHGSSSSLDIWLLRDLAVKQVVDIRGRPLTQSSLHHVLAPMHPACILYLTDAWLSHAFL